MAPAQNLTPHTGSATPIRYEIYSRNGRLLDLVATQTRAEQLLAAWHNAKYLVGVASNGDRIVIREREELR